METAALAEKQQAVASADFRHLLDDHTKLFEEKVRLDDVLKRSQFDLRNLQMRAEREELALSRQVAALQTEMQKKMSEMEHAQKLVLAKLEVYIKYMNISGLYIYI